eukprot:2871174-Prymnesium_polylepis.1
MAAVHAWCGGASFSTLCEMCDLFEGSIIRAFRRSGPAMRTRIHTLVALSKPCAVDLWSGRPNPNREPSPDP